MNHVQQNALRSFVVGGKCAKLPHCKLAWLIALARIRIQLLDEQTNMRWRSIVRRDAIIGVLREKSHKGIQKLSQKDQAWVTCISLMQRAWRARRIALARATLEKLGPQSDE
jgi:hypothetical protein